MNPHKTSKPRKSNNKESTQLWDPSQPVRINRYIAGSGYCSRRKADALIEEGRVSVNGKKVHEPGLKIIPSQHKVRIGGKIIEPEKPVYILLNKPKNTITTLEDPEGRKTVMDLIDIQERVFPVGRLDRNTTGILLLTNDGELAKKMAHPRHKVRKVYHVDLNRVPEQHVLNELKRGISLEDGFIKVDKIDYVDNVVGTKVGLSIHSGRNRIVRRMFEHLGFGIKSLDRVGFGPIMSKGTARGTWRRLTDKEVNQLKKLR